MPDIAVPGGPAASFAYRPIHLPHQSPKLGRREQRGGSHLLPAEFLMLESGIRNRNAGGQMINNSYQLINLSLVYRWRLRPRPPGRMRLLTWSSAWPCCRGDDTLLAPDSLSRSHWNKKYAFRADLRMKGACPWKGWYSGQAKQWLPLVRRCSCYPSPADLTGHFKGSSSRWKNGYFSATAKDLLRVSSEGQFL